MDNGLSGLRGPRRQEDPDGGASPRWTVRGDVLITVMVAVQLLADMDATTGRTGMVALQARAEEYLNHVLDNPDDDASIDTVVVGYRDTEPRIEDFELGYIED